MVDQHGVPEGHLLGEGAFGKIELVGVADVTDTPDLVADVAVSPDEQYAFLANWGEPDCAANSGGRSELAGRGSLGHRHLRPDQPARGELHPVQPGQ